MASTSSTSGCGRRAGSSSCCRSSGPTGRRSSRPGRDPARPDLRPVARAGARRTWSARSRSRRPSRSGRRGSTSTPRPAARSSRRWRSTCPRRRRSAGGDVIVEAAGQPVRTPGGLVARDRDDRCRATPSARLRREREARSSAPSDRRRAGRREARDHRHPRLAGREDPAPPSTSRSTSATSAAPRPAFRSRSRLPAARNGTSIAGYRVAATGEIQLDGSVSRSAGIKQKTVGVRSLGRGRLPRPGWGKREHCAPLRRDVAHRACGEFSTGVALPENASRRNSLFAGISPLRATPANCGDFIPEGGCTTLRPRPQWPLFQGFQRQLIGGDRGDDGQALRCDVRRLLLPPGGPLRSPREHDMPNVQGCDGRSARTSPAAPTRASPSRRRARRADRVTPAPKIAA